MSFSIDIQSVSTFKQIRITNHTLNAHIDLITKGGLLNSWVMPSLNSKIDFIDGNDFSQGWQHFEDNGFKSGKMNPFSCRLFKGEYTHENKSYHIDKFRLGQHTLHGLIYDADFEIVSTHIEEDKAFVILKYDYHRTYEGFPFEYSLELKWIFSNNNKVTVQTIISNHDKISFPMMDGWHPYFTLGENIDNCTIRFKHLGMLEYDNELIPTGHIVPNKQFEDGLKLNGIELDNGYLLEPTHPTCVLENDNYQLIVTPNENYPYLQLYTPTHRKSIAIENLTAAPNCFNNKMGLHIMQPHSTWKLETSFQIFNK